MDVTIERLPPDVHLNHERARTDGAEHLCQILAMDGKILAAGYARASSRPACSPARNCRPSSAARSP